MSNEFRRITQQIENGVPGFTSPQVLSFLSDLVLWKRPDNAIEIGSYMGRSSMAIGQDEFFAVDGQTSFRGKK